MRIFRQYEKAFALVYGERKLVMIDKQSSVWTKASLCGSFRWFGHNCVYVRVKSNDLLPPPTLDV